MRAIILLAVALFLVLCSSAQDFIERPYFPGARAKNAAVASARYAEEAYHYTKFTTYISAIDSSRLFADTALFFVRRSMMLADTSGMHAPQAAREALYFLREGRYRVAMADSVIRGFYPFNAIYAHHYFGTEACYHLSNGVMDLFNASLLLDGEKDAPASESDRYDVLPFKDEIVRLEADETAFQHTANHCEKEISILEGLSTDITAEISKTPDQKTRHQLRVWLDDINAELLSNTNALQDISQRIREIRFLLDRKYLDDVKNVADAEHVSRFETTPPTPYTIAMDEVVPDGLIYKIQLGYYPSDVDVNNFHGLFPISGETVRKGLARFYAGTFFTYAEASKGNSYVRKNAIANAFVVPFHNGKKISVSRAIEIEKARGVK